MHHSSFSLQPVQRENLFQSCNKKNKKNKKKKKRKRTLSTPYDNSHGATAIWQRKSEIQSLHIYLFHFVSILFDFQFTTTFCQKLRENFFLRYYLIVSLKIEVFPIENYIHFETGLQNTKKNYLLTIFNRITTFFFL